MITLKISIRIYNNTSCGLNIELNNRLYIY